MSHVGISAFGLCDGVCLSGVSSTVSSLCPASVIVPNTPLAPMRTGRESRNDRLHSGMYWPELARVDRKTALRRVPVPLAWEMFVESRGMAARWQKTTPSFAVSDILSSHIRGLLKELLPEEESHSWIVAIPNHLDEYAQEALLSSLRFMGGDPKLIWRPVAAAMRWLCDIAPRSMHADDKLAVIYAGADAFELTTFSIRKEEAGGKTYLVPLRGRPDSPFPVSGLDWAFSFAESVQSLCRSDEGALWQAVFRFPDIWQRLTGKKVQQEFLPWSTKDGWKRWNPGMFRDPLQVTFGRNKNLSALCGRKSSFSSVQQFRSWRELIQEKARSINTGRSVRGIVLCGPMAHMLSELPEFADFISPVPRVGAVWCPLQDCIAEGAALYGDRLEHHLPTYQDTLPSLKMVYLEEYQYHWADVVEETTIRGGDVYRNEIRDKFQLEAGSDILKMYLRKEAEGEERENLLRRAEVAFPEVPQTDIKLRVEVEMRPAAGLAKVVLVPEDAAFLGGRGVPFDFRRMHPCKELPQTGCPYPEDMSLPLAGTVDWQSDTVRELLDGERSWSRLTGRSYMEKMYGFLKTGVLCTSPSGTSTLRWKINEKGETGCSAGDKAVAALSRKVAEIWPRFKNAEDEQWFLTRATYLWRATPSEIQNDLYKLFKSRRRGEYIKNFNFIMEAASRCLQKEEHCRMFYEMVKMENSSSVNYVRAVNRLLTYYGPAKKSLNDELGYFFVDKSLEIVKNELQAHNINRRFFVGAQLFLMALKQRANNHDFMNREKVDTAKIRYDAMTIFLEEAQRIDSSDKVEKILKGLKDFMDYHGENGIIQLISEEAGETL